ncbi:MAG: hypothetical protein ACQESR_17305 [Planctomycetota bacterium]
MKSCPMQAVLDFRNPGGHGNRRARKEHRISSKEYRTMKLGRTLINTGEL